MNKVLKGLVAVAATAAMAVAGFAGASTATAAEVYTLTINNTETGHTYEAYQVFKGRLDNGTLSDIEWGTGVDGDTLSTAKYDGKSAKEIAKSLNNANAEAFANNVAGGNGTDSYLKTATGSVNHWSVRRLLPAEGHHRLLHRCKASCLHQVHPEGRGQCRRYPEDRHPLR